MQGFDVMKSMLGQKRAADHLRLVRNFDRDSPKLRIASIQESIRLITDDSQQA